MRGEGQIDEGEETRDEIRGIRRGYMFVTRESNKSESKERQVEGESDGHTDRIKRQKKRWKVMNRLAWKRVTKYEIG